MNRTFETLAEVGMPHPCCVPSKARAVQLSESQRASAERVHITAGSTHEMMRLDGGRFLMGTASQEGFPQDGEGPIREIVLDPFFIDIYPVTNLKFEQFVKATGYRTEAERFGWSLVLRGHILRNGIAR